VATPSKGVRVTPRRAAELERLVAVEVARLETRIGQLERQVAVLSRSEVLAEALTRARVAADLNVLQSLKGPRT
jgi:hypothetical protein